MARAKSIAPTEAQEQAALFTWARSQSRRYPALGLLYAIPNGGSRNLIEARHLKEQGVQAGVPDVCLPVPNAFHTALYIEMKRTKDGKVSDKQKQWLADLNRVGCKAVVAYGFDEARQIILEYLRG